MNTQAPTTTIETITPETARLYLEFNSNQQRSIRYGWVRSLSKMIKDGDFILTHQSIAFDKTGALIDGQHRLLAIVDAEKPARIMVTRGVDPEAWHATDQGVVRTAKEVTGLERRSAESARFIAKMVFNEGRPSSKKMIDITRSRLGMKIEEIRKHAPSLPRYYAQVPMLVIASLRDLISDSDDAKNQYRALTIQDFDSMSSASKALCRQVTSGVARKTGPDMYCRAWVVFDPKRAGLSKIQVLEDQFKPTISEIRFQLESWIKL